MKEKLFNVLFSEKTIGSLTIKNSFIRGAMAEMMATNGIPSESFKDMYKDLAEGGGMITTGMISPTKEGISVENLTYFPPENENRKEFLDYLSEVVDIVHEEDCAICAQLGYAGMSASSNFGAPIVGPIKQFNMMTRSFTKPLSKEDIEDHIEQFVKAGKELKALGFDAIEMHCAHGYLFSEFLSPAINKRKDEYGGKELENRMRFPIELLQQLKSELNDFPIIIKMNYSDCLKNGIELNEAIEIAKRFEENGADAIIPSCGVGFLSNNPMAANKGKLDIDLDKILKDKGKLLKIISRITFKHFIKTEEFYPLYHLEAAKEIQKNINIPVIYVGGITSTEDMEELLDNGFYTFQIARWFLNEPKLIKRIEKITKNKTETRCIQCNNCVPVYGQPLQCIYGKKY